MPGVKGQITSGRPPKPRKQHERDGTFRGDRHAGFENAEAPPGIPQPPKTLAGEALEEWNRMIARLTQTGALSVVDDGVLYQYCRLFAETEGIWIAQQETVATIDILQENIDSRSRREVTTEQLIEIGRELATLRKLEAGYITKVRQGRMALRQLLVEFGLTPAARGRVKLPEKKKDADPFTAFQQKRPGIVRVK